VILPARCPAAGGLPGTPARGRRAAALLALLLGLLGAVGVLAAPAASAHPLSFTAILLDVGPDRVTGEVQLPIDRLSIALAEPTLTPEVVGDPAELVRLQGYVAGHTAVASEAGAWDVGVAGGRVERIDGVDHVVYDLLLTPPGGRVQEFTLSYDGIVHHLLSHRVLVSVRAAGAADHVTAGILDWRVHDLTIPTGSPDAGGFLPSLRLGTEHISEGADHLLFLVMLLLPAPLLAAHGRWVRRDDLRRASWRVVHVVTAFAVGHSLTLVLGAVGLVHIDSRVVESLIAVSILASAVHAVRPLVPGGETAIAVGFGLVHGLAFAALIDQLGLGRGSLVVDLLGFNLGIEITQLLVVALLMPSLVLLSRTGCYPAVRVTLAAAGAVLAAGWLVERVTGVTIGPLDHVSAVLVEHPFAVAGALAVAAVLARWAAPRLTAARGPRPVRQEEDPVSAGRWGRRSRPPVS